MNLKPFLALMIVDLCSAKGNPERNILCDNIVRERAVSCFGKIWTAAIGYNFESELVAEVRVAHNDAKFENELNEADEKLVIIDFYHGKMFPPQRKMVKCINKLAVQYADAAVWLLVDGYDCGRASADVLKLSLYPTYVFQTKNVEKCRFHGLDNDAKDCGLIEHKMRELLGHTKVQVAATDDELNGKLVEAKNKLVLIFFTNNNLSDSEHAAILSDLEGFARDHEEGLLIVKANYRRCPHGVKRYRLTKSPWPVFVFVQDVLMKREINVKYDKEKINREIKEMLNK